MMLLLRWLPPPQPLVLRWRVPVRSPALAQVPLPAVLAAVIGPPGPSGAATIIRTAGQPIGGHRPVEIDAAGMARLATGGRVAGVTVGAASAGAPVKIQTAGELVEPSWNWAPGAVWLGAGGTLTQIVPTTGPLVEIGIAAGPTSLVINPRLVALL